MNRIFYGCENQPENYRVKQVVTTPIADTFGLIRDNNFTLLFSLTGGIGGMAGGTDDEHPDSSPFASYADTSGTTLSVMPPAYSVINYGSVLNVTTAATYASYGNYTTTTLEERGYTLSLRDGFFHRLVVSVTTVVNGAGGQAYRLPACSTVLSSSGNQSSNYIVFADVVQAQRDVYHCNDSTLQIFMDNGGIRTITYITLEADEAVGLADQIRTLPSTTSFNNEVFFQDADGVAQANSSNFLTTLQHSESLYYIGRDVRLFNTTPTAIRNDTLFFEVYHGDQIVLISVYEYTPTTLFDLPTFVTPLTVALMIAVCAVVLIKNLHPDAAARIGRVVFLIAAMTDNQNVFRPSSSRVGFEIVALPKLRQDGFFNNGNLIGRIHTEDDQPFGEEISLHEGVTGLENTTTKQSVDLSNEAPLLNRRGATASADDTADDFNTEVHTNC
ncbi:hypothetical protein INT44_000556 [Umbelopsis vinacea]|uniref:Uncharacterized protein n=1 Tax=Umbelopsis vinacea TaxID=44442 RepID=A0A8H7UC32_9FUNG|nr:hypothetical protein INT44_000556 [Umbelopsis vinacea]